VEFEPKTLRHGLRTSVGNLNNGGQGERPNHQHELFVREEEAKKENNAVHTTVG
jgi:hypothetical protein